LHVANEFDDLGSRQAAFSAARWADFQTASGTAFRMRVTPKSLDAWVACQVPQTWDFD